jgi:methionyl aminopeptidase
MRKNKGSRTSPRVNVGPGMLAKPSRPLPTVFKGSVTPMRTVPAHIGRPDYAETGEPMGKESPVKDAETIERMRAAGRLAAETLAFGGTLVAPGVTTEEIDRQIHEFIVSHDAYPSPLNYHGYPKAVCTSVNEVICHGIPDDRVLQEGEICNIDVTVYLNGVHGDTNATFFVGEVDDESRQLVDVTHECMMRGIEAVKPGEPFNVIGKAIETHAREYGYGVIRSFVGHGIGTVFHNSLQVLHYYDPRDRTIIQENMTFTIEPMISMGSWRHVMWDDDWTAVTADLSRTAQFEHTLVVTADGAEILTKV